QARKPDGVRGSLLRPHRRDDAPARRRAEETPQALSRHILMRIAFVHQYFPGQFARLARHFLDEGHDVLAFDRWLRDGRSSDPVPGVRVIQFGQQILPEQNENRVLAGTARFIREASSLALKADEVKRQGWLPDVVYSHTGWGSAAYLHDVFPAARYIKYCEW